MSVPPPSAWVIAKPTSAAASAGASFTPSPTIATRAPALRPSRSACTTRALSAGSTSASTSVMPTSRANASAAPRSSPLTSTARRPSRCSAATAAAAPGLAWSPKASRPNARGAWPGASSASQDTLRPCGPARSRPGPGPTARHRPRPGRPSRRCCPASGTGRSRRLRCRARPRPGACRPAAPAAGPSRRPAPPRRGRR